MSTGSAQIICLQECIPVGCVPPVCCPYLPACTAGGGVYLPGPGGYLIWGRVPAWSWGVYLPGLGGYLVPGGTCLVPGCTCLVLGVRGVCPGTPPLWTEFLTHASENITLPQTSFAGSKNCDGSRPRLFHCIFRRLGSSPGRSYIAIFLHIISCIQSGVGGHPN